jgi:hypothetical protein
LFALESSGNDPIDFTNNAWYPDGAVWWTTTGGSFASIAAAKVGLPKTAPVFGYSIVRHQDDVIAESNPFVEDIQIGVDYLNEIATKVVPTLRPDVKARNAGVAIPNVTDGFSGVAPDIGAIIAGRTVPQWGALRASDNAVPSRPTGLKIVQ